MIVRTGTYHTHYKWEGEKEVVHTVLSLQNPLYPEPVIIEIGVDKNLSIVKCRKLQKVMFGLDVICK